MADIELVIDGTAYGLDALEGGTSGLQHLTGKVGRFMPPVRYASDPVAASPGRRLVDVQLDGRDVTLPVAFVATDLDTVRATMRTWAQRLDPTAGDVLLRVNDVAPARELVCRYVAGFEGRETWEDTGHYSVRSLLVLRSASPYWRATDDETVTFTNTGADGTVWFPIFPLVFGAGSALTGGTVTNGGNVDTWPSFTCTGPFDGLTLRNNTTGRTITTSAQLDAGEVLIIDAAPASRSLTLNGTNLYSTLTAREWWPLVPGVNSVSIEGGGGFDTATQVVMTWRDLYLTA